MVQGMQALANGVLIESHHHGWVARHASNTSEAELTNCIHNVRHAQTTRDNYVKGFL